jgi:hypothetical protein
MEPYLAVVFCMDEIDIWPAADLLIKQYGDEAMLIAAKRAAALLDLAESERCLAWIKITRATIGGLCGSDIHRLRRQEAMHFGARAGVDGKARR